MPVQRTAKTFHSSDEAEKADRADFDNLGD